MILTGLSIMAACAGGIATSRKANMYNSQTKRIDQEEDQCSRSYRSYFHARDMTAAPNAA